jgi:protein-L-isoaspartate O-methyltransferase
MFVLSLQPASAVLRGGTQTGYQATVFAPAADEWTTALNLFTHTRRMATRGTVWFASFVSFGSL